MNIDNGKESASSNRWSTTAKWLSLLLVAMVVTAYWGVWRCGFVNYDDNGYFYLNKHVLGGLSGSNLWWALTTGEAANWHPLTWESLSLDATLFGSGPVAPHVTNLLLHTANTVLLFWLLWLLTGALWRSFLVAALFGIHPMHVESVAWVAERKDVLSGFFFMLTMLAYRRYVNSGGPRQFWLCSWYWVTLLLFVLGLMSKPMLVTVPFVLLLLDWWPMRRLEIGQNGMKNWALLWEKMPFLILSVGASVITFVVQKSGGAVAKLTQYGVSTRLENAVVSYGRYFAKLVLPSHYAIAYPFTVQWPISFIALTLGLLAGMSFLAVWMMRKQPYLFSGWFWYLGTLVPVIGLVQVGGQSMADRYSYLPSIGVFIMLVWGLVRLLDRFKKAETFIFRFATASYLVFLLFRTHVQTTYWQNDGTLFRHAIAVTDRNYTAYVNYGTWLSANGDAVGAMRQYDHALELNPMDCDVLFDVGNGFAKLGDWDKAIECYGDALQVKTDQADIYNNLGFALVMAKRYPEAVQVLERSLQLKPDYGDAHNNLASVLFRQGDFAGAANHFAAAAKLIPDNARIAVNLGDALLRLGQTNEAAASYRRAVELEPGNKRASDKLNALISPASH